MADFEFDFERIFERTTSPQALLDAEFRVLLANDAYCTELGVKPETLLGANVLELFPEDQERQTLVSEAFSTALAGRAASLKEIHYAIVDPENPSAPKREMWWNVDCIPMQSHPQHGTVFLVKLDNVTEEMQARHNRDVYAAELQHRIGNVLTLVQIIARKTAQASDDLDSFRAAYESRIRALGKTHAFLSGANWDGMTVRQVLEQQIQSEAIDPESTITIEGPEWRMSVLHAQTFAMGVHELMANAATYGALSMPGGRVSITWDHPKDGSYNFVWKESGMVDVSDPAAHGFGMQLLTRLLPGQLEGSAVCAFTPTGFHYMLVVPTNVAVPVGQ